MKNLVLILLILVFSVGCQSIREKASWWWDDFRGVSPEKSTKNPEMIESEKRLKQYSKYENDMDAYRVLRD